MLSGGNAAKTLSPGTSRRRGGDIFFVKKKHPPLRRSQKLEIMLPGAEKYDEGGYDRGDSGMYL